MKEGDDPDQLLPNGEASDVSSEAEEESETPGCEDGGAENLPSLQRSIIEDIRSGLIPPVSRSWSGLTGPLCCLFPRQEE